MLIIILFGSTIRAVVTGLSLFWPGSALVALSCASGDDAVDVATVLPGWQVRRPWGATPPWPSRLAPTPRGILTGWQQFALGSGKW